MVSRGCSVKTGVGFNSRPEPQTATAAGSLHRVVPGCTCKTAGLAAILLQYMFTSVQHSLTAQWQPSAKALHLQA